jgi:hypothetical protein
LPLLPGQTTFQTKILQIQIEATAQQMGMYQFTNSSAFMSPRRGEGGGPLASPHTPISPASPKSRVVRIPMSPLGAGSSSSKTISSIFPDAPTSPTHTSSESPFPSSQHSVSLPPGILHPCPCSYDVSSMETSCFSFLLVHISLQERLCTLLVGAAPSIGILYDALVDSFPS